jgi:putative membrane protein
MRLLKKAILGVLLNIFALFVCQEVLNYLFSDFYLSSDLKRVIIFAVILAGINLLIKPVLKILFLPLIWITLGFFSLIINIFLLKFANFLYPTITIHSFSSWLLASIIVSLFNSLMYL